jgi:hypothetical protein
MISFFMLQASVEEFAIWGMPYSIIHRLGDAMVNVDKAWQLGVGSWQLANG